MNELLDKEISVCTNIAANLVESTLISSSYLLAGTNALTMLHIIELVGMTVPLDEVATFLPPFVVVMMLSFTTAMFLGREDTGKNFTDQLYSRVNGAGITTFRDKNELKRGSKISSKLFEAIHGSNVFLVVFSKNYATSKWCLDELVEIMKRKNNFLFVWKQTGSFEEAFVKHQKVDINKVSSWREALADAGELSGWDLDATNGHEGELIKKIVEQILSIMNHTYLHVANHLVGIDTRMDYINSLLSVEIPDVLIVGIYGMGGIGKTTLAKAVFNHSFHSFESKSFLANIRQNSMQNEIIIHLQEQFLSEILQIDARKVRNVDQEINVIKDRLCNRRVLLVLDDVDQLEQLIAFSCQSDSVRKECFGPGSRIIIATRHLHLLARIEVNRNYMVEELDADESLKLFSLHAFERTGPLEGYVQLSKDVAGYCNGLPLALEVLGSCLREFRSIAEWEYTLEKLRKNPHAKIQEKLIISFDALDDYEKEIFLDIACFFIGRDEYDVTTILEGCGFYATSGIGVLTRRCLLMINKGKLMMLRDMGRKIVYQKSVKNPGQRSRLWHWEDALEVGTDQIEGLALNTVGPNKVVLSGEAFAGMHKLRLLQLKNVNVTGGYEHLPKNLRWLLKGKDTEIFLESSEAGEHRRKPNVERRFIRRPPHSELDAASIKVELTVASSPSQLAAHCPKLSTAEPTAKLSTAS
ncbi:disease resistance protein RPV1-like [Cornus florida]|uniref:disease resistance protein RPV1-like n=1 Tax=Cornus florida TaxID=4283 RepID=UPI0028967E16|nr:disease resistance protein RPV1-like [Cornus florida]